MANNRLIMAGVATVEAFAGNEVAFTANTLTESSLTIGLSAEDVRGGQGAGLLGRYFHTSTFELTLTDALFNLDYIKASVGGELESGANVLMNEQLTATSTTLTLSKTPVDAFNTCTAGNADVWFKKVGDAEWTHVEVASGATITVPAAGKYCVKYFYANAAASKITITSDYIPSIYRLVLKENLYAAGESSSAQTKVGHVEIIIPRFQLDGSQDLSMSMTGASTTSLKGSALVSEDCEGCDVSGYYAEMIQVLDGANWTDGITGIAVDQNTAVSGQSILMWGIYGKKTPIQITDLILDEGIGLQWNNGAVKYNIIAPSATGTYTLKLIDNGNVVATTQVSVVNA